MDKNIAIEFQGVGKQYRLGRVGTGTLQHDLNRFWQTTILGKEDPYLKIGEVNDRSEKAHSDYVWALKDINFKVEQGDVVGIIGKNGAGKSTLLKLLSHITSPTTGDIYYRGRIASLLEVGTGFHGELTGKENIYMNGAVLGMTKHEIRRKLDDIIEFAGVEKYIDTPVKRYSSGMTVRLGFAVAAFLEPEILVVDEVLTVGDAEFQKRAIGKMDDVAKGGRTVLFVSHNMASVRSLCKSGIVLRDGMLNFQGTADEAVDQYLKGYADDYDNLPISEIPRTDKTNDYIRFTNIEFLNEDNQPITPHSGRFLRIRLTLMVNKPSTGVYISVGFRTMLGDPLLSLQTSMTHEDFDFSSGEHHACIDIPKLPLTDGEYRLGMWCNIKNPELSLRCADYVDNVIKMNVVHDSYFGRNAQVAAHLRGKIVLCEHSWDIE